MTINNELKTKTKMNHRHQLLTSALLLELGLSSVSAGTILVDGITCTFEDAVQAANTDMVVGGCLPGSGDDEIILPINANITLSDTAVISSNITISGNGSTLDGDSSHKVISIDNGQANLHQLNIIQGSDIYNTGAGISVYQGYLYLNQSTVSANQGGGIHFFDSTGLIRQSTIDNNTTHLAAFYSAGVSVVASNVTINQSTISNNTTYVSTYGGGGLHVGDYYGASYVTLINSTLTGNETNHSGGGLLADSQYGYGVTLDSAGNSIVNNDAASGGGLFTHEADTMLAQTLVSGNTDDVMTGHNWSAVDGTSLLDADNLFGHQNLSGLVGVVPGASDLVPSQLNVSNVVSTTLADLGGPTMTLALPPNSPALDAVSGTCLLSTDQRDMSRPVDGDFDGSAECDIGAVEAVIPDLIFEDGFD